MEEAEIQMEIQVTSKEQEKDPLIGKQKINQQKRKSRSQRT